jgi:hypothetical protein
MPDPRPGERYREYIPRCVREVVGEGKQPAQARAICESYWERRGEKTDPDEGSSASLFNRFGPGPPGLFNRKSGPSEYKAVLPAAPGQIRPPAKQVATAARIATTALEVLAAQIPASELIAAQERASDAVGPGMTPEEIRAATLEATDELRNLPAWRQFERALAPIYDADEGPVVRVMQSAIRRTARLPLPAAVKGERVRLVGMDLAELAASLAADFKRGPPEPYRTLGGVDLTPVYGNAAAWMRANGATRVTLVSESTQRAIAELLALTFEQPQSIMDAARSLLTLDPNTLGLNRQQMQRLAKDVARWREAGMGARELERRTRLRAKKYRRERAILIARTETQDAGAEAQRILWQEAAERGELDPQVYVLTWRTVDPCEICGPMQGATAEITGGDFTSWVAAERGPNRGHLIRGRRPTLHPR